MSRKIKLISLNLLGFLLLAWPSFSRVLAEGGILTSPIKDVTIAGLIDTILSAVLQVGVVVVSGSIIYAGFKYVTAQGNSTKLQSAHKALGWTMAGSAIVLGAYTVRAIVMETVKGVFGA